MAPLRLIIVFGLCLWKGQRAVAATSSIKVCLPGGSDQKYAAANVPINFSRVINQAGKGDFSTSTYTFKSGESGYYLLYLDLVTPAGGWAYVKAFVNGNAVNEEFFTSAKGGSSYEGISFTATLNLGTGDTLLFKTSGSDYPMTLNQYSCFVLVKIG